MLNVVIVACVLQYLFQQLGVIVAIVKLHIRSYLDDIFELIKVFYARFYFVILYKCLPDISVRTEQWCVLGVVLTVCKFCCYYMWPKTLVFQECCWHSNPKGSHTICSWVIWSSIAQCTQCSCSRSFELFISKLFINTWKSWKLFSVLSCVLLETTLFVSLFARVYFPCRFCALSGYFLLFSVINTGVVSVVYLFISLLLCSLCVLGCMWIAVYMNVNGRSVFIV